ncbi:hypothetical protein BMS3Bbin02_01304 [bacterium BMS3Bbin02]|nr:hypothetical protein BMS3Bbin02_01304 [bacterium BMS3Bbin02]
MNSTGEPSASRTMSRFTHHLTTVPTRSSRCSVETHNCDCVDLCGAAGDDHLGSRIEQLEAEVAATVADAEATDLAEDEEFGEDRRGDEVLTELARRETRLAKMAAAKEVFEAEAADKAADRAAERAEKDGTDDTGIAQGTATAAAEATPVDRAHRSFTDPESRMTRTVDGFRYAYNAQAVVDGRSQVVLAAKVHSRQATLHSSSP